MFGKSKETDQMESVVSAPKKEGLIQSPPPENSAVKGVPSIFGTDTTLEGNLCSDGEIQFDGKIVGNIRAGKLIVGKDAHVFGEIIANTIIVHGKLRGTIRGRRVEILASGHIEGDVIHAELSVEGGAFFMGNCQRLENPFGDAGTPDTVGAKELQANLETELVSKSRETPAAGLNSELDKKPSAPIKAAAVGR